MWSGNFRAMNARCRMFPSRLSVKPVNGVRYEVLSVPEFLYSSFD